MKVKLPRQRLQDALTAANTLTGGRSPRPILGCVRVAAEGGALEVCATDGEAGLRALVSDVAIEEGGITIVSGERLLGIVRELVDIEVVVEAGERECMLRAAGGEFKLYVQSVADYPPVPEFDGEADVVLDGRELRRMIAMTLYAAARETSRYAINGVLWDKRGKRLFMVATDGRRLARAGGSLLQSGSADFEVIVPSKALTVLERICTPPRDGGEFPVEVRVTPNQLLLRWQGHTLSTVLVEGRFPKYEDVIPKETTKRATVDRQELYGAVRRAALLTTEDSRAVQLSFSSGKLVITSRSPEQGEARVELPIEYEGDALDIGFNPVFLGDALRCVGYSEVRLEMHESFRPAVISGEDKADFLYVVMPVSLSA